MGDSSEMTVIQHIRCKNVPCESMNAIRIVADLSSTELDLHSPLVLRA